MPEVRISDDELVRMARSYVAHDKRQSPPPGLEQRALEFAYSHGGRRRLRRAAAGGLMTTVLVAVAVVALAVHVADLNVTSPGRPSSSGASTHWVNGSLPSGYFGSASAISCVALDQCLLLGSPQGDSNVNSVEGASPSTVWQDTHNRWSSVSVAGPVVLNDLTCVSEEECWAVGFLVPPAGQTNDGILQPVVERETGSGFQVVDSPQMTGLDELDAVTCPSADDCWAVGRYGSQTNSRSVATFQPLVEHFDGTSWQAVTVPAPSTMSSLQLVTCPSTEVCWALGEDSSQTPAVPLLEHYLGGAWTIAPVPTSFPDSAITCVSSDDCWAVGGGSQPVAAHYTAGTWVAVPTLHLNVPSDGGSSLDGVACLAATDCWAVGSITGPGWTGVGTPPPDLARPLVEHYAGGSWVVGPTPQSIGSDFTLAPITCIASSRTCYVLGRSAISLENAVFEVLEDA